MEFRKLKLNQHDFVTNDFCRLNSTNAFPAHSPFADCHFNVHLRPTSGVKEKLIGPGIYAVCYDQKLIYIGKYLGQKKNPFAGNIARLRWIQHLGSMTMRDRRVSLSRRSLNVLLDPDFSHRHNSLIHSLAEAFDKDHAPGSAKPFLQRDRGCLSTVNRVLFALEHWSLFSKADGPALGGFSFHYFRVERPSSELAIKNLRTLISTIEDRLVEAFRPPCNAIIDPGTALSWKRPQVLDDLRREIKRLLSAEDESSSDSQSSSKIRKPTSMFNIDEQAAEPEETSAEVRFFKRLEGAPPEAVALIDELRLYASETEDVELHYTSSNRGDLRLRKHGLGRNKRGNQNFLTLVWQARDQTFLINNFCQPTRDNLDVALSSFVRPLLNDPLKSTMKIDAGSALAQKKTFMRWVENGRIALAMQFQGASGEEI